MNLSSHFDQAPRLRPLYNLGCLFDIPTGRYYTGKHGESILLGGLSPFTGIAGRGNMGKSLVAHWMMLCIMARYQTSSNFHDTEISLSLERLYQLAVTFSELEGMDLAELGRLILTESTQLSGNKWFDKFRDFSNLKRKEAKSIMRTTPFIDHKGEYIKTIMLHLFELDSLSMMITDSVEGIYDKNQIGDSGANTDALRSAAAKTQMLMQLPNLTAGASNFLVTTAHVGEKHQLDQYAPDPRKLAFLKGKNAFKNVPEKFTFLTNNLWYCNTVSVLQNATTKAPEFPASPEDDLKGDTDLNLLTLQNLRAKSGPTGMPFEVIYSQREGLLVGLTEFNYCKFFKFGIGGHDRAYFMELCPEITMQRTTVRSKIKENPRLQRALEITSEMCQMENLGFVQSKEYLISPADLFSNLKAKGYDWDVLLDTRGYWDYEENKNPKNFLSTLDLLKMAKGEYHPFWLKGKPVIKSEVVVPLSVSEKQAALVANTQKIVSVI